MKIIFISDIHGMPSTLSQALAHADALHADRIVILGDILYHGPRNGVPNMYNPPEVVELLNRRKDKILAVRGNCDAEVDQMLLHFPIMADYSELFADDKLFFLTHGHLWNEEHMPDLPAGSIIAHGHTHIAVLKKMPGDITIFNPGSISLPKNTIIHTFGFFDGNSLSIRELDSGKIFTPALG
jgi:putative phosphoesterase